MTQEAYIRALVSGLNDELTAYQRLLNILIEQYRLMSRHCTDELTVLNERETQLLALLYQKSKYRSQILKQMGFDATEKGMAGFIETLPEKLRAKVDEVWHKIYHQLRLCQAQNEQNSRLLASQKDTLNRLLFGEQSTDYSHLSHE